MPPTDIQQILNRLDDKLDEVLDCSRPLSDQVRKQEGELNHLREAIRDAREEVRKIRQIVSEGNGKPSLVEQITVLRTEVNTRIAAWGAVLMVLTILVAVGSWLLPRH